MFKVYINYFFMGTSNTLHSTDFEQDFELNTQGLLSDRQKEFIRKAVKVEKHVNLFFGILAIIFIFFVFLSGTFSLINKTFQTNNDCRLIDTIVQHNNCSLQDLKELNLEVIPLISGVVLMLSCVVFIVIILKFVLPYRNSRES